MNLQNYLPPARPHKVLSANTELTPVSQNSLGDLPQWNLKDLYPSMESKAFTDDLEISSSQSQSFKDEYAGKLASFAKDDPGKLAKTISLYEAIEERLGRIMSYAGLIYAGDTTNPENAKFYGDAQERVTTASTNLLFFTLELNQVDNEILENAIATNAQLAHYRPWLEDLRKEKPYQLDDRVESLFHEKSVTGRGAWNRLFDETMASLVFEIDGKKLASENAFNLLQDPDGEKRKDAALEIGRVLGENARTFTLITNTLAKDKEISDRWRGFRDVSHSRHLANRVEPEVVDALVDAVRQSFKPVSHRYYKMKAKWLGLDQLEHWDRNAPLPFADETIYTWKSAREIVLAAYDDFSPEMSSIAKRFFDEGWIDAPVRTGKSPGAFAHPTVPSAHPYILLNYLGKPRDVMTLAHELGHGVHQVLAANQGLLMSQTPLTLAETASVFGEMLTFRALLDDAKSTAERKSMLARKVEDMINTVVRQIAFYLFERKVHEARREGELTSDNLGKMWIEVQKESLGSVFSFHDSYSAYWSYIPHFIHSPFYVYAYAFGDCLVNSLYAVYQDDETGFQEKYFEMLKAGGSKHHSQLLSPFGLDASQPDFWHRGLGMITGLINQLEELDKVS